MAALSLKLLSCVVDILMEIRDLPWGGTAGVRMDTEGSREEMCGPILDTTSRLHLFPAAQ